MSHKIAKLHRPLGSLYMYNTWSKLAGPKGNAVRYHIRDVAFQRKQLLDLNQVLEYRQGLLLSQGIYVPDSFDLVRATRSMERRAARSGGSYGQ